MGDKEKEKKDFLLYEREKPITFEQADISQIDLRKLREMTLEDLSELYDTYAVFGEGEGVMQECNLKFVRLLMQRATGYPLEALNKIGMRDEAESAGIPFFLSVKIGSLSDLKDARKSCIRAARYSNTPLPALYSMKLSRLWTLIGEIAETAQEDARRRKECGQHGK